MHNQIFFDVDKHESTGKDVLTIPELFEIKAARFHSLPAVVTVKDDLSYGQILSYQELNTKANHLAHYLISSGVKPNMLVGICTERSADLIVGLLAILKAGGAYLPVDLSYPQERLKFMLEDAKASLILTQKSLSDLIPETKAKIIYLDKFDYTNENPSNPDIKLNGDDLAYVIYTSGSTGKPNGVMVTHHNVVRLFQSTRQWFNFNEKDIWTFFHSYAFDFSVWEIWGALLHGGRVVVVPYLLSRSPESFYDLLIKEKVTVLNQTPSAFYQLMQAEDVKERTDQLSLRYVIFGGEALNPAALKSWFTRHGDKNPELINMYGITETTVHVTYRPLTSEDINSRSVIGIPIPDLKVYILDEQLNEVTPGETGEIYVGGEGLTKGYLNRPELNQIRFVKNPFSVDTNEKLYKTGDLGKLLHNNDIEYIGRIDHQVKIRGFRIEPGEIENSIRNYKGIKDCVVNVHKYSEDVVSIIAYFVPGAPVSIEDLKKHLGQFLPEYMLPNAFVELKKIPLTPNGKADLKSLPVPEQGIKNKTGFGLRDLNETENVIRQVWIKLLGYENIGSNDNFFDAGGNSLLMGRLQLRINKIFNENISIVDLFRYPTISSLAKSINGKQDHSETSQSKFHEKKITAETDIAIIGMAGKYPGADNIDEFWKNLVNGVESISFFTNEELEYLPKGNLNSEVKFIKARGYLKDADKFDAEFFGFNPREAAVMDPQHRLFLECAWSALEDAGYSPDKYHGSIGVFAGSSLNTYLIYNVLKDRESAEEMVNSYQIADYTTLTGNDNAFLTTKIAYKLGLKGPAINLQTACSTSLVAVEQAYRSLVTGQCDMALAGGVSITFPQKRGYFFVDGSIGSADGHCKPFDADATGTVFSHGAGIVVLKRLKDAIKDGDSVYAVIKSVAVNNDGSDKAGYMTPSIEGQSEVILKAQKSAGIDSSTIKYVETHGTGTPVGDPIEVASLEKAFRESTKEKQFCGIGSVKSNVGHTDAAAGVTGLIKTVLSLYHRLIPPTLHYKKPNPAIDFANSPFYVVDKLTDLSKNERPLRAAVSAFGVGGTNAHAIIEEFPFISFSCEEDRDKYLLIASAKTEKSLNNNMTVLQNYLKNNPDEALNDVAYTLQTGRKEFEWRQFIVADSCTGAAEEILNIIKSDGNKAKINLIDKPHLVFMFPGQGSQYVNMGKGLYLREKAFREIVDQCAEYLKPYLELDIRDLLYPRDNNEDAAKKLEQTVYTQPALFTIEYALAQLFLSYGIKPFSMIGHSIGDYASACLAGIFSLQDALKIIAVRARLMQFQKPGSMLSVRLNEAAVKEFLNEDISLAAINSPNLVVLSGPSELISQLSEKLSGMNVENRLLYTSHAYHSRMMEPALESFGIEFRKIKLNKPSMPFISSMTGTWITDEQSIDPEFWTKQIRTTVRFSEGILELRKKKNLVFLELGPGRALSTMASQHQFNGIKQITITTLTQPNEKTDDKSNLLNAIGKLWTSGINIDWNVLYKDKKRRKLHLPTYQFDRKSYWIEPTQKENNESREVEKDIPVKLKKIVRKPKVKTVIQESSLTRKEYIADILKEVLEELSGIKKVDLDSTKSFFELGFDSLFMTQVSLAFQKKFEVKITLRQLIETSPTISAIAEFIDGKLPMGKFEPPKQEVVIEEEGEEIMEEYEEVQNNDDIRPAAGNSNIENLIQQQLEIMRRQLEILGGSKSVNTPVINQEPHKVLNKSVVTSNNENEKVKEDTREKKVFERFGPYNPVKTSRDGSLTATQRNYLNKLIKEYTAKTPASKKMTQDNRAHYSDPRTVSGFLPLWKEMTYQVITNKSSGSRLWDLDGNEYIDVIMGFGQYMFGHNPEFVRNEIEKQLKLGFEIGPQSPIAGEVAGLICEFTGMDRAAFCVTGSEAVLGAIRAARTVTGKDKIIFFAGDYHGIIDEVLIKTIVNGDQIRTMPIAPGIPRENVQNTIALEYGTEESLQIIEKLLPEIGGIMVEPVQARRPDFQPKDFLLKLRKITEDAGIPLIFDEVITGFRTAQGGAQEWFGIKADIGTFGKVIGGGFPIGVIAGKKLYMDSFDGGYWQYGDDSIPEAGVTFFAGTFARHPLSLTACYAVLKYLKSKNGSLQKELNQKAKRLTEELNDFLMKRNVPVKLMNFSSVIYYSYPKDLSYFSLLFYVLRYKGIHILEGFPMFLSEAHSENDIRHIIDAFKESVIELQENGFFPALLGPENGKSINNHKEVPVILNRFPLSEAQKEMWIGAQMRPEAAGPHHACTGLYLYGLLNIEILKKSIRAVIEKHEGLRCTVSEDGSEAILHSEVPEDIPMIDLSSYSGEQQEKRVNEIFHKEAKRFLDLNIGPLVDFRIIKLSSEKHLLLLTAQMIICDGWSHYVLFEDLSAFYSAYISNTEPLLEPAVSMREYALWEKSNSGSAEEKACEKFWLSQFTSNPDPIDLPASKVRPPLRTYNGDRKTVIISEELYNKIKNTGIEQKSSTFAILFAAFYVWLYRLSENNDLVIGVPFAAQSPNGMDRLIGQCANTLPLRVKLEPGEPFSVIIKKTWDTLLDAQENWNFSYGRLISKLNIKPDPGRIPLVSILFNIDPPMDKVNFNGLRHKFVTGPRHYFQYDLGFNLVEDDKNINVECDFNPDIFDGDVIAEWAGGYISILETITKNPDSRINDIPVTSRSVKNKSPQIVLKDDEIDFIRKFRMRVKDSPDKIGVKADSGSMTYSELDNYSDRLNNYLIDKGVRSETVVGIYFNRNINLPVAILAVIKSGGAYILLDKDKPLDQIIKFAEQNGINFILTNENFSVDGGNYNPFIQIEQVLNEPQETLHDIQDRTGSLFCLIPGDVNYTDLIELTGRSVFNTLSALQTHINLTSDDVILYHSSYLTGYEIIELLLPLMSGAQIIIVPDSPVLKIDTLQNIINNEGITALLFTPSVWSRILDSELKLNSRIKALSAGEFLKPDIKAKLIETFKCIWNLYGTIETGVVSSIDKISPELNQNEFFTNPVSDTEFILTDDNLQPVPIYKPGEILISGNGLAPGYFKNPVLTSQKFPTISVSGNILQKFYRTGDIARYKSTDEIEFVSSRKNRIRIKGFHFEAIDVERILLKNTLVKSAYLVQKKSDDGEDLYIAYIKLTSTSTADSSQEIIKGIKRFLKTRIPDVMIPHNFVIINDIPVDVKGKFDYESLPLPQKDEAGLNDYLAPRNKTENKLADIWKDLLKLKEVSVTDSFFDLGGQSLLAVRLFNRIEEEFGQRFPLAMLLKAPTIEELSKRLNKENDETSEWPSLIAIQPHGKHKPLYLVHGAGGNVLLYRALSKHLEPDFPIYGLQSQGLDGISKPLKTIEEMAERYLSELQKAQPSGPYYLGGYCLGGTIAYEMAQRLLKMGEKIGIVIMFDTYNFIKAEKISFTRFMFEKFQFHFKNFAQLKPSDMLGYLKEKKRRAGDGGWANIRTAMPGTTLDDSFGRAESGIELTVQTINDHAGDIYIPKPYIGKLTLFKPQKNYSFYPDPKMGWGDLVEDLDIIELPVNPHAMLVDPYVEILASEVKKRLIS